MIYYAIALNNLDCEFRDKMKLRALNHIPVHVEEDHNEVCKNNSIGKVIFGMIWNF